jgi:hypothetical protein
MYLSARDNLDSGNGLVHHEQLRLYRSQVTASRHESSVSRVSSQRRTYYINNNTSDLNFVLRLNGLVPPGIVGMPEIPNMINVLGAQPTSSQRIIKTHLSWDMTPTQFMEKKCKVWMYCTSAS